MKFSLTKMAVAFPVAFLMGTLATTVCNGQTVENTIREYSSPNGIFSGTITHGDGVFDNTGVITGPNGYTADFQRGGSFGDGVVDRNRSFSSSNGNSFQQNGTTTFGDGSFSRNRSGSFNDRSYNYDSSAAGGGGVLNSNRVLSTSSGRGFNQSATTNYGTGVFGRQGYTRSGSFQANNGGGFNRHSAGASGRSSFGATRFRGGGFEDNPQSSLTRGPWIHARAFLFTKTGCHHVPFLRIHDKVQ